VRRWPLVVMLGVLTVDSTALGELSKADCVAAHEQGQRLWKSDRIVEGIELLTRCAVDACPPLVSQECTARLAEAREDLPSVIVQAVGVEGQRPARLDGVELRGPGPFPVNPGEHTASVQTEEGAWVETRFVAKKGEKGRAVQVQIPVVRKTEVVSPAPSPVKKEPLPGPIATGTRMSPKAAPYAYGLALTGVAGLALFTGFGLSGRSKEHEMQRNCAPFCPQSDVDSMHRDYVVADVSLGVGIAALAATLVILHVWREPALPDIRF
jgi:hypothetical protein